MNKKRNGHAAVTLNNKIYVFEGYDFDSKMFTYHKSIEIYDAQKNNWTIVEYDTRISHKKVNNFSCNIHTLL